MEMEPVTGYAFANWEKGYGDFHLAPDLSTLRVAGWLSRTAMVVCDLYNDPDHKPVQPAPRMILKTQIQTAAETGYHAMAGSELEHFLFRNAYRQAYNKNYSKLAPAGWYLEDYHMLQGSRDKDFNAAVRRHLRQSGISVESSKGEWGHGQHEINIKYADALTTADRHALYKQCLKKVADQLGCSVTFMAKYAADQAGSWAPTRIAWSHDNRTAGFRVVGRGYSLCIECRILGAATPQIATRPAKAACWP